MIDDWLRGLELTTESMSQTTGYRGRGIVVGIGTAAGGWVVLDAIASTWPRGPSLPAALAITLIATMTTAFLLRRPGHMAAAAACVTVAAATATGLAVAWTRDGFVRIWSPEPLEILARLATTEIPYVLLGVWAAIALAGALRGPRGARG